MLSRYFLLAPMTAALALAGCSSAPRQSAPIITPSVSSAPVVSAPVVSAPALIPAPIGKVTGAPVVSAPLVVAPEPVFVNDEPPPIAPIAPAYSAAQTQSTPPEEEIVPPDSPALTKLTQEDLAELELFLTADDVEMVESDQVLLAKYGDLWNRIRNGYQIPHIQSPRIEAQKNLYIARQDYLDRMVRRASRYLYYAIIEAERRGLPTELALLPFVESSYDPTAISRAGAVGLWQFMPATGIEYNLQQTQNYDGRYDIIESTNAAYNYLSYLYGRFGTWELALAAYNAGPGRVSRAIERNRAQGLPTDYWSLSLSDETQRYVPRLLAMAQIVKEPAGHGVYLPAIANKEHFGIINANYGTTLQEISEKTGIDYGELKLLNPGLLNGTVSDGPLRVIIPNHVNASTQQVQNPPAYQSLPTTAIANTEPPITEAERQAYIKQAAAQPTVTPTVTKKTVTHQPAPESTRKLREPDDKFAGSYLVKSGDTLTGVARAHGISISELAKANQMSVDDNLIKDKRLKIPSGTSVQGSVSNKPTRYRVRSGDTLTGIAQKFNISLSDLASYNGISTRADVYIDQNIYLVKPANLPVRTTNKASAKTINYRVKAGDTLIDIASAHGLSAAEVAEVNDFGANERVQAGRVIKLPASAKVGTSKGRDDKGKDDKDNAPKGKKLGNTERYTVKAGDTLIGLADRFGVSIADLAATNNLAPNARILRGQTLNVPKTTTTYKVKSGDSLIKIARAHGISTSELAKLNGMDDKDGVRIGQILTVPNR